VPAEAGEGLAFGDLHDKISSSISLGRLSNLDRSAIMKTIKRRMSLKGKVEWTCGTKKGPTSSRGVICLLYVGLFEIASAYREAATSTNQRRHRVGPFIQIREGLVVRL
jgi:hypothetical protein